MVTVNGYTLLWEDEASDDTFDLVNYRWSKATGGTNYIEPSVNANGSLNIGRGYVLNLLRNGTHASLYGDFKLELDLKMVDCNFIVGVSNNNGFVEMECYTNGNQAIRERDSTYTTIQTTNIDDNKFTTTEKPRNTLIIKRLNGVISFEWVDVNGSVYSFTSTNVTTTTVMNLRFRGFDGGSLNIHRLSLWQKDIVPTRTHNPNYTTLSSENNEDGFDLTKWSQHIPTENADGSIRPIYGNNYYDISFPNDADWKLEMVFKFGGNCASFTYIDNTYGNMVFSPRTTSSVFQKFEWVNGVSTKISETTHNPIYVDANGYSTLALIGKGKDIMWKYTNTNGDIVSINRTYTNIATDRKFYIYDYQSEDNYVDLYSITLSKMSSLMGTGTGTVTNGRAEGTLQIQQGKKLLGGYSYTIFADYPENSNYEHGVAVGTLEVLKKDTYTTISGNTTVRNGELLVLNISVTDKNSNPITSGSVTVYDGNEIIQNSYLITSQTVAINFIPMTAGVHNIRAIYTPSDNQYNGSNSNVLSVSAVKGVSELSLDDGSVQILRGFGRYLLTGNLSCNGEPLTTKSVRIYDFSNALVDTVITDIHGDFAYPYEADGNSVRDDEFTFRYDGDDFYEPVQQDIDIHVGYAEQNFNTVVRSYNLQYQPRVFLANTNEVPNEETYVPDWITNLYDIHYYNLDTNLSETLDQYMLEQSDLEEGNWLVYMIDSYYPENSFACKFELNGSYNVVSYDFHNGIDALMFLLELINDDSFYTDIADSLLNQISLLYNRIQENDTNFSLANYGGTSNDNMSSATTVNRFIDNDGYLDCGVNVNTHHSLPSGDEWIIEVEAKMSGDSAIVYNNTVDGTISFRTKGDDVWKLYDSEQYTYNTSPDTGSSFNDNNHEYNTLTITRHQNKITFSYIDTNDEKHTFTKTYNSLSENGTLYFRVANGSLIIKSLTFITTGSGGGNKRLPIEDSRKWIQYVPDEVTEGQATGESTFENDGTITLGQRQRMVWYKPLDLQNKDYIINLYNIGVWCRIGVLRGDPNDGSTAGNYKTIYSYTADTTGTSEQNKYKIYLDNGIIYHEWISHNNERQLIWASYDSHYKYYLYFYTPNNTEKLISITEKSKKTHIKLPIDTNEWTWISRGEGSVSPVEESDGTVTLGQYYYMIHKHPLDKTKLYNIYFYTPASNGACYFGVSNNSTELEGGSFTVTNSTNGVVSDINKMRLYFDTTVNRWIYQFNEGTPVTSQSRDGKYFTASTINNSYALNVKILAITEKNPLETSGTASRVSTVDLPILENSNWAFISRGEGSTEPVFSSDGINLGIYSNHIWKQAIETNKKYNIFFIPHSIYYDMSINVVNKNDGIPTRGPGVIINVSNAGITPLMVNKATIYYDNSVEKWCIRINDDSNYNWELIEHSAERYLGILSTNASGTVDNKIIAITEEFTETDLPIFDLSKWRVTNREGSTEQTEPTLTNTGLQLGKYKEHILTQIPLDTTKTYKIYHKDNNSYCYYGVLKKLNDGTEYINQNWRRTYNSWGITSNTEVIYKLYCDGTNWKMEYNGEAKNVASITVDDNEYYLYICPINEGNILQAVVEM